MRRLWRRLAAGLLCVCLLAGCTPTQMQTLPELTVTVADIGKADAILIRTEGHAVLIDTGEAENGDEVCAMLEEQGVIRLDYLILTHLDKDHIGGAAQVLAQVEVDEILQSFNDETSEEYAAYQTACQQAGLQPQRPRTATALTVGEAVLTVIPPKNEQYEQDNDYSLMIEMTYGERRFLFAGDAEKERLAEYLNTRPEQADLVKMPHHGRAEDNTALFVEAVSPDHAVITCSKKNPPDDKVLTVLEQAGADIFLTANGTVTAVTDGTDLKISQQ